jgi:hypothetical protein
MPASCPAQPGCIGNSTIGRSADCSSACSAALARTQRERLFLALLALAQPRHRGGIARIAREVKAAEPLDRDDAAAAQQLERGGDRVAVDRPAPAIDQRQRRSAHRAGVRLGVEAPVQRIGVFAQALRALGEWRHAGLCAVVGQGARQRVARPALRAVDEGIAVAPVGGIEQFGQAVVAGRRVGRDCRRDTAGAAGEDAEVVLPVDAAAGGGLDALDACQRRGVGLQSLLEPRQHGRGALDFERHAFGVVEDPAGQAQLVRQAIDERAEADTLHRAAYADRAPLDGGFGRGQHHGHVRGANALRTSRDACNGLARRLPLPRAGEGRGEGEGRPAALTPALSQGEREHASGEGVRRAITRPLQSPSVRGSHIEIAGT